MDILAGVLAYVAAVGALFAGLAISFSVFVATPKEPLQAQNPPQSASAMLVRPTPAGTPKSTVVATQAKPSANHSEKQAAATGAPGATQLPASARHQHRRPAASTAQARRLIEEGRARRWAYQQDSSFKSRFLGYAD